MTELSHIDDVELGRLISMLPPAPKGWVEAAQQLPAARATIDEIVERCGRDQAFRESLGRDLEAALRDAGYALAPRHVESLRARL